MDFNPEDFEKQLAERQAEQDKVNAARTARRKIQRKGIGGRKRKEIIHGTIAGYKAETLYTKTTCPECKAAWREWQRARRLANREKLWNQE